MNSYKVTLPHERGHPICFAQKLVFVDWNAAI
jgi:hypothetical protein